MISEQIIRLFYKLKQIKIKQEIIDIYDDGLAKGTKVVIEIIIQ